MAVIETMKNQINVSDINLAAALAAIGIPLKEHEDGSPPFIKLQTGKGTSFTFFFESEFEGMNTQHFVDAWHDDEYIKENPEEPFAYIKAAMKENRPALLDVINQSCSLVCIEKGKKFALISSNATEEQRKQLLKRL